MSKRELVGGAAVVFIISAWLTNLLIGFGYRMQLFTPAIAPGTETANVLGWVITLMSAGSAILGTMIAAGVGRRYFPNLYGTLNLRIPYYFVFTLVPVANGLALLFLTGGEQQGIWLACLSMLAVPVCLLFSVVAMSGRNGG